MNQTLYYFARNRLALLEYITDVSNRIRDQNNNIVSLEAGRGVFRNHIGIYVDPRNNQYYIIRPQVAMLENDDIVFNNGVLSDAVTNNEEYSLLTNFETLATLQEPTAER